MAKSTLAQDIHSAARDLANILNSNDHGVLRGTMEAVLIEAQGGRLIGSKGRGTHQANLENAQAGLIGRNQALHDSLSEVGSWNWQAARLLSHALRPLREMAQTRSLLIKRVLEIARELQILHPAQHSGTPLLTGKRDTSLVSSQINALGGIQAGLPLVPGGLADHPWVRETLDAIKKLPITSDQAGGQVLAVLIAVRTALQTSITALDSPIVDFFGSTTNILLSIGNGLYKIDVPPTDAAE